MGGRDRERMKGGVCIVWEGRGGQSGDVCVSCEGKG